MSNSTYITATSVLKEGCTAVITGASSGIGRAMAIECSRRGMNVWMVDIDKEELEVAKELVYKERKRAASQVIESRVVDVSDIKAVEALANEVFSTYSKQCHFLMNNAGIGKGCGPIPQPTNEGETYESILNANYHKTMGVNTFGPIHGCMTFVPKMKESGQPGIIVNTGSKQGITMPPGNIVYNMSKAALKCYTEGLEHELRQVKEGTPLIRSALLVPGWVNTSIMLKTQRDDAIAAGETNFDPSSVFFHEDKPAQGAWMPAQVVSFLIEELDKGSFYIICPDNDVDRETDNLRMTWTMQDITENRPPLSRWHDEYKDKFTAFLEANRAKKS